MSPPEEPPVVSARLQALLDADANTAIPIQGILSPGGDPTATVADLRRRLRTGGVHEQVRVFPDLGIVSGDLSPVSIRVLATLPEVERLDVRGRAPLETLLDDEAPDP